MSEQLLESLLAKGKECEYIEYKENNTDPELIGEYLSALSNSASIKEVDFAYLVFGVSDTLDVVGTKFLPSLAKVGNEDLELWLQKLLEPSINFEILEFTYNGDRVSLFKIPASTGRPTRFSGKAFIRIGQNKRNLKDFPEKEALIWNQAQLSQFETRSAIESLTDFEVLNAINYAKYFELTNQPLPQNNAAILEVLRREKIISKNDDGTHSVTNLGTILFSNDLTTVSYLKRKAVRVIVYDGVDKTLTRKEKEGGRGYAVGFENLIDYVNEQLPSNEEIQKAIRVKRKMYPEIAIRELVANALIHQDLSLRGAGPMIEIYDDRIEISNPGRPLIEVNRFLDHNPRSRNENLASFMRRIGVCEERGSGIDKVISSVEAYQLPAPRFDADEEFFKVTLYSPKDVKSMSKEDRVRASFQHCALMHVSNKEMTNSTLRTRFNLSDSKTDSVFTSNIINETIKLGLIKLQGDPNTRKGAKYIPFFA